MSVYLLAASGEHEDLLINWSIVKNVFIRVSKCVLFCAEHEEGGASGADTRGQATQTAYPEQPRTPPATSAADASAQRPSDWALGTGGGDQGHVVASAAVPAAPEAAAEGEWAPASRGQSAWAVPAAVQPVRCQPQLHA